ncbi:multiple antibiotic resistance protein [Rhodoligotrophos appendicifer]|uniref:MarC family protein n=1 Tax=Rhodoligotrophos appendicifer TaxID=987056 RepID=UPI001186B568|nr:MarC family protein [Rhodoligotrophos appendicifer]
MIEDQTLFITQLTTLWIMLDPFGLLPLFMGATTEFNAAQRRRIAVYAAVFALIILLFFGFIGQILLHAMGVSLIAFQIAGGIILLMFAIGMVLGEMQRTPVSTTPVEQSKLLSVAVFPLATPMIAGPGAMLTTVLLMDNNRFSFGHQMETALAMIIVLAFLASIFMLGDYVLRIIGEAGANILRRVMGMILAAVAVNLILTAFADWLSLPSI